MLSRVCDTVGEEDRRLGIMRKQRVLDHHSVHRLEVVESIASLWTDRHRHIPRRSCKATDTQCPASNLKGGAQRREEHKEVTGTGIVPL